MGSSWEKKLSCEPYIEKSPKHWLLDESEKANPKESRAKRIEDGKPKPSPVESPYCKMGKNLAIVGIGAMSTPLR
jgi:hypothetical protein